MRPCVRCDLSDGDTVAIAGAAGGVARSLSSWPCGPARRCWVSQVQATTTGCTAHGAIPVNYGDNLADRLRAAAPNGRVDAFLDFFGGGYVELALTELGIEPQRVDTIIDFAAVERFGVQSAGLADASSAAVLAELAGLIAAGQLEVPIAEVVPLVEVQRAYRTLEARHTRGKIVLRP